MRIQHCGSCDHFLRSPKYCQTRIRVQFRIQAAALPPKTCSEAVSEARAALRRYREACRSDDANATLQRKLTMRLPLPSPTHGDDLFRGFDEGEWPGGVRQRFRSLRPLVESFLDGWGSPTFQGMLESAADGMGVWSACNGDATIVTYVSNATFAPFVRLCDGEFGTKVQQPQHMLLCVNPNWSSSADIGQLWDRELKAKAAKLIDDPSNWLALYHLEDTRTAAGALGILQRSYPDKWRLWSAYADGEDEEGALLPDKLLLESEERPERAEVIALLNAAAKERAVIEKEQKTAEKKKSKSRGWWGGL